MPGKFVPIEVFARIKPVCADKAGGGRSEKGITSFDENGSVECGSTIGGKAGSKSYSHFSAVIPPDATNQAFAYEKIAAPRVAKWLEGYNVDVICYGQTGSGKTYTMFGPPHSMAAASSTLGDGGKGTISSAGVMKEDYGFILRTGFEALGALERINSSPGRRAVLHASMVEMSIMSFTIQGVLDLLNKNKPCHVDKTGTTTGAVLVPIRCTHDLVKMAARVETRITRGTKMNDSSSRSHCMTVFTLSVLDGAQFRQSRLQYFDLMGSERFKGNNAAHDASKSSKSTLAGWEGIFSNFSLMGLGEAVREAAEARRKGKKPMRGMQNVLTSMLKDSLQGHALTTMITCLSVSERNGAESVLAVQYSFDMARLLNNPQKQREKPLGHAIKKVKDELKRIKAIVQRGVAGKYQALRSAQLSGLETKLGILKELKDGAS